MTKKLFLILLTTLVLFGYALRLIPALNHNFYYTMDQGYHGVYAREISYHHRLLEMGDPTSISGLYNGPLWLYFIALGQFLFRGNPIGSIFLLSSLSLASTVVLVIFARRFFGDINALILGIILQLFWPFYELSRYSFNPFPLAHFAIFLILLLISFINGNKKSFIWAAIPVGLVFHCEMAPLPVYVATYTLVGTWGFTKGKLNIRTIFYSILVLLIFFIPHIFTEFRDGFPQYQAVVHEFVSGSTFSQTNFPQIIRIFLSRTQESLIPQSSLLSTVFLLGTLSLFLKQVKKFKEIKLFVGLSALMYLLSIFWFGLTKGYHQWQSVYIPPLIFVSTLFMLFSLKSRLKYLLIGALFVSQFALFAGRYWEYFHPSSDASILANEIKAVDWVYQKADGKGFYEYNYLPSVYDYPYQYLFWWWGRKQYGYVPCEYSTFPGAPKTTIPSHAFYEEPKRECAPLRFLIVEPDRRGTVRQNWIDDVRAGTTLLEETSIGRIHIEKRKVNTATYSNSKPNSGN